MALPTPTSTLDSPSHSTLHGLDHNVKAYGAAGDYSTDDTAAIQAAIDAATGDSGRVVFPQGAYLVSDTLSITGSQPVGLYGVHPKHGEDAYNPAKSGAGIIGTVNGPIIERLDVGEEEIVIQDIAVRNLHTSAGTGISIAAARSPSAIYRCAIHAFKGIETGNNIFMLDINSCQFRREAGSPLVGSRGITGSLVHGNIYNCDFNGFERGINLQSSLGVSVFGGRIEVCSYGIYCSAAVGVYAGTYFEACDIGIFAEGFGGNIAGCVFNGTTGSPTGGSDYAIQISGAGGVVTGCQEQGGHSGNFIIVFNGPVTLVGNYSTAANAVPAADNTVQVINNYVNGAATNRTYAEVIATGSLPAAAATQNGRVVIEDAGTGNRNLILYAGGERFRIDGGANV